MEIMELLQVVDVTASSSYTFHLLLLIFIFYFLSYLRWNSTLLRLDHHSLISTKYFSFIGAFALNHSQRPCILPESTIYTLRVHTRDCLLAFGLFRPPNTSAHLPRNSQHFPLCNYLGPLPCQSAGLSHVLVMLSYKGTRPPTSLMTLLIKRESMAIRRLQKDYVE